MVDQFRNARYGEYIPFKERRIISMKETILKLLNSDIKTMELSRETGITHSTISKLRNGKRDIGETSLNNALKLYNYQKQREKGQKN